MTLSNNNIDDKIIETLIKYNILDDKLILMQECLEKLVNNLSFISLNYEKTLPYLSITNINYHITNYFKKNIVINTQSNIASEKNILSPNELSKLPHIQIIKNFDFILKKCSPKTLSLILKYYGIGVKNYENEIKILDTIIHCFFIHDLKYKDINNKANYIQKIYFTPFIPESINKTSDIDSRTFTIKIKNTDFYNDINGIYVHIVTNYIDIVVYGLCNDDPLHIIKNNQNFIDMVNKINNNTSSYKTLFNSNLFNMLTLRHILIDSNIENGILVKLSAQLDEIKYCNELCTSNKNMIIQKNNTCNGLIINKQLCNETSHFLFKFATACFDIKRFIIIYLTNYNIAISLFLFDLIIKCNNLIAKKLLETLPILIKNIILHSINSDLNTSKFKAHKSAIPLDEWFENIKIKFPDEIFTEKISEMIKLVMLKNNSNDSDGKAMQWLETIRKIPFNTYHNLEVYSKYKILLNQINTELLNNDPLANPISNDSQIWKYLVNNGKIDLVNYNLWIEILNDRKNFLNNSIKILDTSIYGQTSAKKIILNILSKLCYIDSNTLCIGISGCPGIGKTTIVKEGIAKCLINSAGQVRPFITIPLGGATHASYLEGHGYTYQGSTIGRIIAAISTAKVMNPIIYFDELDKVSASAQGEEIINLLIHLTDPNQNTEFLDKYCGFPLNLSKCIFVFTFNDTSKIDKILLDRILHIELEPLAIHQKLHIFKNFALKKYCIDYGFNYGDIIFTDESIINIIKTRTAEGGVRKLIELIHIILAKIKQILLIEFDYNLLDNSLLKNKKTLIYEKPKINDIDYTTIIDLYEFPSNLKSKLLIEYYLHIISNLEYKILINSDEINSIYLNDIPTYTNDTITIPSKPGIVYALYSNKISQGGVLKIEIKAIGNSSKNYNDFIITGNIKEVMKESIKVAYNIIESILFEEKFNYNKENYYFLNFPSLSIPKDGPSATGIIAIGFYSLIKNITISPYFSMTGEINLSGFLTKIGGLTAKINGALLEGIRTIIIPHENYINLRNLIYIEDSIQLYPIKIIYFLYREKNNSKLLIRIKNNKETLINTTFIEIKLNISKVPSYINQQAKISNENVFIININDFDITDIENYPTWLIGVNKSLLIIAINNLKDALKIAINTPQVFI